MDRIITINLDEFLEFVEQKASDREEEYMLNEFMKDTIDEYLSEEDSCPQCGGKLKEEKTIWSKTEYWILEYNTICKKCGYIMKIKDNRNNVKEQYLRGNVRVRDVEILKEELGIE
jgi:C4-type Zn-finger protein